jgi:hypothetical protein
MSTARARSWRGGDVLGGQRDTRHLYRVQTIGFAATTPWRAGDASRIQHRFIGSQQDAGQADSMRARPIDDPLPAQSTGMIVGPGQQHSRAVVVGGHGQFGQDRSGRADHGGDMGVGMGVHTDDDINLFCQDLHCGCFPPIGDTRTASAREEVTRRHICDESRDIGRTGF